MSLKPPDESSYESSYWVWLDCEMTGLNPETDRLLELATVITNHDLDIVAEGPNLVIHQPSSCLSQMNAWCLTQHTRSGLIERVQNSAMQESEAESITLDFLNRFLKPGLSPLCGNSVWQDRRFMIRYMPRLADFFHYRNIDVSTLKELFLRWWPDANIVPHKQSAHLALSDIYESIEELKAYRSFFERLRASARF